MKIDNTNYIWDKVDKLDPEEHECFYEIERRDPEDYDSEPVSISFVTDIFSGAIAILDDFRIKEASSDTVEKIVNDLRENNTYIDSDGYIYCLNIINLWKARKGEGNHV